MKTLPNIHPGKVLQEEFLRPMDLSAYKLAKASGIAQSALSEIMAGKRRITAETALRLSKAFGTSSEFWLNLQNAYDLEEAEKAHGKKIAKLTELAAS